jgi:hypothetical protein
MKTRHGSPILFPLVVATLLVFLTTACTQPTDMLTDDVLEVADGGTANSLPADLAAAACTHQLYGICFKGETPTLDITYIFNEVAAREWCEDQLGLACDLQECTQRVAVLAGVWPMALTGNFCLPQES